MSRELDVRADQLRAWPRQARERTGSDAAMAGKTLEQENRRLRRELAVARQEHAFATKVAAYFAKESR